jgi:hypothetical protein
MKPVIVLDIETIPRPLAELERIMPAEMLNPVMPQELAHPEEPDWLSKCPQYSFDALKSKLDALAPDSPKRADALARVTEAGDKRNAWIMEAQEKWERTAVIAQDKWKADTAAAKAKFINNAALDAARGQVKLIGVRVFGYSTQLAPVVFAWEPDQRINATLGLQAGREGHGYNGFLYEKQAIAAAFAYIEEKVRPALTKAKRPGRRARARVLTFYGNTFDLPFLARRGSILGLPSWFGFLRRWRRGRYLDGEVFIDVHEEWKAADRDTHTGGLEALAKLLGYDGPPKGDAATFFQWYQENPEEGVAYLLNDLSRAAHIGRALGFIE